MLYVGEVIFSKELGEKNPVYILLDVVTNKLVCCTKKAFVPVIDQSEGSEFIGSIPILIICAIVRDLSYYSSKKGVIMTKPYFEEEEEEEHPVDPRTLDHESTKQ